MFSIIVAVFVLICSIYCLAAVVEAQSISDEERKKLGLGPKGQGRK